VPTRTVDPAQIVLERQKRAANRLRKEVMGADGSIEHPYYRSFDRRLRDYEAAVSPGDLAATASLADIVYVGDYHAVPAYQVFAADLLERVSARAPRLVLGIEFVYTRQQRLLDRRQAGKIADDEFLRRLHYEEEWGHPWEGSRILLDRARELGIEVHALDAPPRGGLGTLQRRDDHAARRIVSILETQPDALLMVLFGETHLARSHLPRRVKTLLKQAGIERREIVVFQNPDRIYWKAVDREDVLPSAVRVDAATYAALHTSPLQKYEAYRQVLDRWGAEVPAEEEFDLTPAVHHLIHVLLHWLGIRASRRRLRHRAGWTGDLEDALPEGYSGAQASELLEPILNEHGRSAEELQEARGLLERRGALYESRSNTLFLCRYLPGPAAGEAARFLRAALTGRLFIALEDFSEHPAASAYGAAFNEALAFLGARLVDPTTDFLKNDVPFGEEAADLESWLELHHRFETSRRQRPPVELLDQMGRSRPLRRRIARDVGRRLGATLFEKVRTGTMPQRDLRRLFTKRLDPDQAVRYTLRLLRGAAPA
jgi:hypothetical protein